MLSVVLMILDQGQQYISPVRSVLSVIVAPIQEFVDWPIQLGDNFRSNFIAKRDLLLENERLRVKELLLQAQVQKLIALQNENSQLKTLLHSAKKTNDKVLVAQLLAVDVNPFVNEAVLNKGKNKGVYVGQPVLDANGIMGQIIAVGPITSRLMLISDRHSAVPVQNSRNGVRAIAIGTGSASDLHLVNVPETADMKIGDILISSGMGQRYPIGYPVATITRVIHNTGYLFSSIRAKPFAHLDRSRHVILVWPRRLVPTKIVKQQVRAMQADTSKESKKNSIESS